MAKRQRSDSRLYEYDKLSGKWTDRDGNIVDAPPPPIPSGNKRAELKSASGKRKTGRGGRIKYKEYKPQYASIARKACEQGMTIFEVANLLNVHENTLYKWRLKYPQFGRAFRLGQEEADNRVELALYSRAVGHKMKTERLVKTPHGHEVVEIEERLPPDVTAAMHYLKNRRPDRWKEVQHHSVQPTPYDNITSAAELRALLQKQAKALGLLGPIEKIVDVTPEPVAHDEPSTSGPEEGGVSK